MADAGYVVVFGHEELRRRLARAAAEGRLPQSLLLYGPRGIGKQRLALWTAAMLNCHGQPPRPCGECIACRLCSRLEHPDIHWFFPLPRPKRATGAEQLRQKLEEARAAALQARRENPAYVDEEEGATGIYVAAVHTMRRLAQKAPAMGPRKLLIIGRAETMTPGMGSPEAANALLKLLEEPPDDTTLILTSDVPGALLPTIRSRVQAVRVAPLPGDRVAEFLRAQLGVEAPEATRLAGKSSGSIGRALELREGDGAEIRQTAMALARAAIADGLSPRLAVAHGFRGFGARGSFAQTLGEATAMLRDLLASSAGAAGAVSDPDTAKDLAGNSTLETRQILEALEALEQAKELADRNVNPQLIVANLERLRGVPAAGR